MYNWATYPWPELVDVVREGIGQGVDEEDEHQQVGPAVDIEDRLQDMAPKCLSATDNFSPIPETSKKKLTEVAKKQLAEASQKKLNNLEKICNHFTGLVRISPPIDEVQEERLVAAAFMEIADIIEIESTQQNYHDTTMWVLKKLERNAQDLALLACCRHIEPETLQQKGTPKELLCRLEAAFPMEYLVDDTKWSKLGNSRFQIVRRGRVQGNS
jgi:hypothetical protein